MVRGVATIEIAASAADTFDLLHDYAVRLNWDPFLREAKLLGGDTEAGPGVCSRCTARLTAGGCSMDTRYVSFRRPTVAAVKMIRGPAFLADFAATIRHTAVTDRSSRLTYIYQFSCRPRLLRRVVEPVVSFVFRRETRRRLRALKRFLEARSGEGHRVPGHT